MFCLLFLCVRSFGGEESLQQKLSMLFIQAWELEINSVSFSIGNTF